MEIRFDFGGEHGRVMVEVVPNADPVALGKTERERGMPVCTASVEFSAGGYRSMLGWVQLVREPAATDRFEVDPFDLFADSSAPFAWYGFRPVLFDAPSRWRSGTVQWQAHSFLTIGPWDGDRRHVVPLVGFAWGYEQDAEDRLHLSQARLLRPADWDGHRGYLAERYPTWTFSDGSPLAGQR
ncbi:hypothetical protein [Micromonospora sp. RP3T]|uniref:hypothetical protein n=1 Tax=Micromonospora sp. RP3T TaxID=2135446 RepID=UPI000D174BAE|nr:hypothetical protein [Micromonospora sp. RP3T]PTA47856.1 hypothetical protein C8054_03140 [Micromonospora sp. RP3T]